MTELVALGVNGPARSTYRLLSALNSDNPNVACDRGADLHQIIGHNAAAAIRYLKIYDKKTAPASTDTPILTFLLPASLPFNIPLAPIVTQLGLGFRLVTGAADNDNTAVTAGDILALNLIFS